MTDARERRRERHEATKESPSLGKRVRALRIPIAIFVVWAAIVGFQVAQAEGLIGGEDPGCPGHWHPVMSVYVNDQNVPFSHPAFQQHGEGQAAGFHVHDDSGVLHFHPATERCIPLKAAMGHLGMEVEKDAFVLDGHHALAGSYPINETHTVRVFTKDWGADEWKERSLSFLDKQPWNGQKILLTYGDADAATIAAEEAAVPDVPSNYEPQDANAFPVVQFIAATSFAIVAFMIWRSFTRNA